MPNKDDSGRKGAIHHGEGATGMQPGGGHPRGR